MKLLEFYLKNCSTEENLLFPIGRVRTFVFQFLRVAGSRVVVLNGGGGIDRRDDKLDGKGVISEFWLTVE